MASGSRQPRKGAPNAGSGKRAWRTPIPHLSLSDRKVGQGLIVLTDGGTSNAQHRIENKSLNLRFVGRSEFVVGCWMFSNSVKNYLPASHIPPNLTQPI